MELLLDEIVPSHPELALAMKKGSVGEAGNLLLWRFRDRSMVIGSLYLCVMAYCILMCYYGGELIG
ncbi:MAG: hypothetical protein ABFS39_04525 [Pseudomonadota bacterium]